MNMLSILVRVLAQLLAALAAFAGTLIFAGLQMPEKIIPLLIVCGLVVGFAKLDKHELAEFERFQKQRLAKYGIEI